MNTPAVTLARLGVLILTLLWLSGCATNPVTGKSDFVLVSEGQELAMGKQASQQVLKQYEVFKHNKLTTLVNRLGKRLADNSHRSHLNYKFTVLDSPEVNAFALPGGYIYITRGIMAYMNSEEELAGVLGHEIGHVTARHGVKQQSSSMVVGILGAVASAASNTKGVGELSNMLGTALVRGYGRSHELQADRLGSEYLARIGHDPMKMLDVVAILKNQEELEKLRARDENRKPQAYHGLFSTHPRNDQRLQEVVAAAEKFKRPNQQRSDPEQFIKILDGVTYGNAESQGMSHGNRFYHKGFDFTLSFPKGWRIQNEPNRLLALNPAADAVIIVMLEDQKQSESPAQFLQRKFGSIQQGQRLGAQRYAGVARVKAPFNTNAARVAAVYHKQRVFTLLAAAKGAMPASLFHNTVKSVRKLKSNEQQLASEQRIQVIRARPGDTFAQLAKKSDLGKYTEQRLRVLNAMYPDGEPRAGQLIKVVR